MPRGFETGSDNEKIDDLQRQMDDINDSQINAVGGNENISIDSTRGSRNDASGDAGGVRSNQPVIHQITDVDSAGSSTGVFDKINLISSMIIVDHTSTPIDLRFIQGTAKDGVRIKITPKVGKSLVIKSGGNILTSTDITVSDTEFYELVKHSEAETGVTGGAYKISISQSSGGSTSPPFIDSDPLVKGSVDDTKLLRFEVDGFTAATTRVITIPNASVTMAGLEVVSQSWTGTNTFNGTSTFVGSTAVRTAQFFIQNTSDITKQMIFALAGATTGKTITIASNHTDNRTLTLPNTTTDIAGLGVLSQTWTGTNIFAGLTSVRDTNFFIQQTSDITKQLKFDLAGGTTGQVTTLDFNPTGNRTITFFDSSTTVAGLGVVSQTWTGTNIFAGNVAVRDTNFFVQNTADITKQMLFDLAGATTGFTLTLESNHTGFRTLTFPNTTTSLAGLGVVSQSWTGTNDFIGTTTVIDSNFGIRDFSDNTKVASFDSSLISTSTTRTLSIPNSTTTLAGLGVVDQSWTGTNRFFGPTFINGDITLGDSNSDNITFIGDTVGNITPNTDGIDSIGSDVLRYNSFFLDLAVDVLEIGVGQQPTIGTDRMALFCRPNDPTGKTEFRVRFQTGGTILIVSEV